MVLGLSTGLEKGFSPLSKRASWAFRAGLGQLLTGTSKVPEVNQQEPEVKANRLGAREAAGDRAELGERDRRAVLVVETDGRRDLRLGVAGCQLRSGGEDALGGDWTKRSLEPDPLGEEAFDACARAREACDERRLSRWSVRVQRVLRADG